MRATNLRDKGNKGKKVRDKGDGDLVRDKGEWEILGLD